MKRFLLPVILLLNACSMCKVPYGSYESFGGSESHTTLSLNAESYTLIFEHWAPAEYENRAVKKEEGKWICTGETIEISAKTGLIAAKLQTIGENPLGLPTTTRALVFESDKSKAVSNEILYFSEDVNQN